MAELSQVLKETHQNADTVSTMYADLIASLSPTRVSEVFEGFLSTECDGTTAPTVKDFERWLLSAIDQGLLTTEFKSVLASEQLDELRASVNGSPEGEESESSAPASDPFEQVVHDYKTMSSREFKNAWMQSPDRRQLYEQAISEGRI